MNQENDGQDRTKADVEGKVNDPREQGEMEMDMETKWGTARRDQRGDEHEENYMIDLNAARGENSMIIHQAHLPRPPFIRPTLNISLQPKWPHDTIQSPPRRVIDQVITIPPYHDTPHQNPSLADYPRITQLPEITNTPLTHPTTHIYPNHTSLKTHRTHHRNRPYMINRLWSRPSTPS